MLPLAFSSCAVLASARAARSSARVVGSSSWVNRASRSETDGASRFMDSSYQCRSDPVSRTVADRAIRRTDYGAVYNTLQAACRGWPYDPRPGLPGAHPGEPDQGPELEAQLVLEVGHL